MDWTPDPEALRGRLAVVAGATRGAGRGIAAALGECGATVICTGRSSVCGSHGSDYKRPETIEETAELVSALGGRGIAAQVDHLDIAQVRALAGTIESDFGGHIDILSTTSGAPRSSRERPRRGAGRCGSTTSTTGCASCASASTPTSSPRTACSRC